jgi:hypothetical protein
MCEEGQCQNQLLGHRPSHFGLWIDGFVTMDPVHCAVNRHYSGFQPENSPLAATAGACSSPLAFSLKEKT